jgi:uncharacterized membrane protein YfcA
MIFVCYLLLGLFVGFLAGLLGVGGGMTIVPTLLYLFTHYIGISNSLAIRLAIGTSLATIIVTAITTTLAHHKRGAILWPLFWTLAPGVIIGALLLGPAVSLILPANVLRQIFAIFCILMAFQMFLASKTHAEVVSAPNKFLKPGFQKNSNRKFLGSGIIVGTLSSLLGVAGGVFIVALLNWHKVSMRNIVGTTAAIGLPIAISGTIAFIITGWHETGLPKWSSGFVYWPAFLGIVCTSIFTAPLGVRLAHHLPVTSLKKIFAIFLIAVALSLLVT